MNTPAFVKATLSQLLTGSLIIDAFCSLNSSGAHIKHNTIISRNNTLQYNYFHYPLIHSFSQLV